MYYSNAEERLRAAAERSYTSSYGRFVGPSPARAEIALRFYLGYYAVRSMPIVLNNPTNNPVPNNNASDMTAFVRALLAKHRAQHKSTGAGYVVTTNRSLFTDVKGLADIYRSYLGTQVRGGPGWVNPMHESVLFGMYMLYDGNTPAVFSVDSYTSLTRALARQMHEVTTGEASEPAEDANQIFLNPAFAPANPLFVSPDTTGPKLKRLTCRCCGAPKLSTQRCLVCGFTPRQRS